MDDDVCRSLYFTLGVRETAAMLSSQTMIQGALCRDEETKMTDKIKLLTESFRDVISTTFNAQWCLSAICLTAGLFFFVAGRGHSSHRRLSVRTLQGGGHPVEEWSQCSRPAEREPLRVHIFGLF